MRTTRVHVTSLVVAGPVGLTEHDVGPGHPERPTRLVAVMEGVRALGPEQEIVAPAFGEASLEELARVHDPAYLTRLAAFCAEGGGAIDADTSARADSWGAARRAAGAGLAALETLEARGEGIAFVPVRPPGHHATADRAMGFCLVNNVAVAAAVAHGAPASGCSSSTGTSTTETAPRTSSGTTRRCSTSRRTNTRSTPGRAVPTRSAVRRAPGLTLNLPLPPGATGDVVRAALDEEARATIEAFGPDWVLVSCGFDAHRDDPLSNLQLSSGDFAELARIVREFAPRPGRLALFLEGGYDATALASSVEATLGALLGRPATAGEADAGRPRIGGVAGGGDRAAPRHRHVRE